MPRRGLDLTAEAIEKMTTEDIAKLPKKQRRKANEMIEKINAKKEADANAEELRLANLDKERKRIAGIEKKKMEKENQTRKDDERHKINSEEVAKMKKTNLSVEVTKKTPNKKRNSIPFHKSLAHFLSNQTDFRNELPEEARVTFDKLVAMSTHELAETLLENGFSFKTPHHPALVIDEILSRCRIANWVRGLGPSTDYYAFLGEKYWLAVDQDILEDKLFYTLSDLIVDSDWKYFRGFSKSLKKDNREAMLALMDSIRTFLVLNGIAWRETRLIDIIRTIEEPNGRMVRWTAYLKTSPKIPVSSDDLYEKHPELDNPKCRKYIEDYLKQTNSSYWLPLVPEHKRESIAKLSDELFEMCSEGILK